MRGAFADPRFRRLLVGNSLSSFGDTALYLTLGIWAKSLTHSNAAAGAVFLALGIPALFAPLAGHLADRARRRSLLITANAITAAMVLSLLAVRSVGQLWIIYLVAFCYGISFDVLGSAGAGLRKDMLADDDLAAANAALQSIGYGMRIVAPLVGAGLFVAFGGGAVAIFDAATFAAAIGALASIKVDESAPEPADPGSFWRDLAAGFRHIRAVPVLAQITFVTACAFAVIGLGESAIFAVIAEGLHKPPSFFGVISAVQGAGAIIGGVLLAPVMRRIGAARVVGLGLAGFALGSAALTTGSVALCLGGMVFDGIGLVWLVAGTGTATQRHTPPRLQGRVSSAWTMVVLTPQTVSIAAGAALISFVDYRLLLLAIIVTTGTCASLLLIRPAPEPVTGAEPVTDRQPGSATDPLTGSVTEQASRAAKPASRAAEPGSGAAEPASPGRRAVGRP
jgi:MFS family permease